MTSHFEPLAPRCRMCNTAISKMSVALNDIGEIQTKITCHRCGAETESTYSFAELLQWVQRPPMRSDVKVDLWQYLKEVVVKSPPM